MLTSYIEAAMRHALIEYLPGDGVYYGEIPELKGVWADGPTQEVCRTTLREVLEEWLMVSLARGLPIPPIEGHILKVEAVT